MKKWLMLQILLCAVGMSQAMEESRECLGLLELPSAQVLKRRLQEAGFSDFIKKTRLDKRFTSKRKTSIEMILLDVDWALNYYIIENLHEPVMEARIRKAVMQGRKWEIIELILQDFPEALEELKTKYLFPENRRITL